MWSCDAAAAAAGGWRLDASGAAVAQHAQNRQPQGCQEFSVALHNKLRTSRACGRGAAPACGQCALCRRARSPQKSCRRPCQWQAGRQTRVGKHRTLIADAGQAGGQASILTFATCAHIGTTPPSPSMLQAAAAAAATHSSWAPNRSAMPRGQYTRIQLLCGAPSGVTTAGVMQQREQRSHVVSGHRVRTRTADCS